MILRCWPVGEQGDVYVLLHPCDSAILLPFRFNFGNTVYVTGELASCRISTGCQTIPQIYASQVFVLVPPASPSQIPEWIHH